MQSRSSHIAPGPQLCAKKQYNALYSAHYHTINNYLLKFTKDPFAAEDICQEVFLKLWSSIQMIHEINEPQAYLLRMARNEALNQLKRRKISQTIIQNITDNKEILAAHTSDYVQSRELEKLFLQAINQLSPQRKKVYVLGNIEGWSRKKIAACLNISEFTVKATMKKAIESVRTYISQRTDHPQPLTKPKTKPNHPFKKLLLELEAHEAA